MDLSRTARSVLCCSGLLAAVTLGGGCRPSLETSPGAVSWPALARDPAENGAQPGRWPGWRGLGSQGIASAGSPAVNFAPDRSLRWKADIPGFGNSSPVVWDGLVLLTSSLDSTRPPTLVVIALDRHSGKLLWQSTAGQGAGSTHGKNGYASATVATDGTRIFAFFGSAGLFCFDVSGKRLWRAGLGRLDKNWGTAASPVLYKKYVIQLCDSADHSYLAAFDRDTGRRVWYAPRASDGCWSTPVVVPAHSDHGPRTELIVNGTGDSSGGMVIAYDPDNGQELWRVRGTSEIVTPTILAGGGLVFSTSGRNGPILAIRPGGSGDVTANRLVWKANRGGPYVPTGLVYRHRLYVLTDQGNLVSYDPGNGQRIWGTRLRGSFTTSLVAADGRIYAANEQGTFYVVAAADHFQLLATNRLDEQCLATPAIADGDLFVRTAGHLYCVEASDGRVGRAQRAPP
jgi:outer membrane protein assembly factor BamB